MIIIAEIKDKGYPRVIGKVDCVLDVESVLREHLDTADRFIISHNESNFVIPIFYDAENDRFVEGWC